MAKKSKKITIPAPPKANASVDAKLRYLEKINEIKKRAAELKKKEEQQKSLDSKISKALAELRKNPMIRIGGRKK